MRVKAIQTGYYGDMLRYAGDVFDLIPVLTVDGRGQKINLSAEDQFSHEWMVRLDGNPPPMKKKMPGDIVPPPPPPSDAKLARTGPSRVTPARTVADSTQSPMEQPEGSATGNQDVI